MRGYVCVCKSSNNSKIISVIVEVIVVLFLVAQEVFFTVMTIWKHQQSSSGHTIG